MFFLNILIRYLIPILYDSFIALVLVLFFLFIFRIKDPNIRISFFILPLIKPFIVIAERIDINKIYFQYNKSLFGFRIPDPANFLRINESSLFNLLINFKTDIIITIIISCLILIFLCLRWINLAIFYKKLAYEEKVSKKDIPEIYEIIENFTKKIKTKSPDVSLTYKKCITPFIVGLKNFTLVFSPNLIEILEKSEKETLIQHELCHIKRKDNLIGWIALILRDLNFFNPFAYISYFLIRTEQEKACDLLILKYSNKTGKEVAKDILNSILKLKLTIGPNSHLIPVASSPFSLSKLFGQRRLENRINSILLNENKKLEAKFVTKFFLYCLFVFLLLLQIIITLKIGNFILVLR